MKSIEEKQKVSNFINSLGLGCLNCSGVLIYHCTNVAIGEIEVRVHCISKIEIN